MIVKKINKSLPIYINLMNGWCLSIWNCNDGKYYNNLWQTLRGLRITIRKDGNCKFVIKEGII